MEEKDEPIIVLHPESAKRESWERSGGGGAPFHKKGDWSDRNREAKWQMKRRWLEQNIPVCPECGDQCSVCHSLKMAGSRGCCLKQ